MAHPLSGADVGTLGRAFAQGGWPDHWGRAAGVWAAAFGRAPITAIEHRIMAGRLPAREDLAPVFILGHWRSGTTHLYNTMSHGDWGYVSPIAVGLPWDMFGIAAALRPVLERALPEHRWIDRIPVTPTSPQEDEIGIASMSPLSFYHGIYFPKRFETLVNRGLFFDGCTEAEIAAWEDRFILFLARVAHQQKKPLLIKNPVYTGRVARLRRLFPWAKFIHIHRNPFDVFLSMRNFYARLLDVMAFQRVPEGLDVDAVILAVYDRMMRAYVAESADLPPGSLVELPYAQLDTDPIGALGTIYDGLGLDGFAAAQPAFEAYLETVARFEKNAFRGDRAAVEKVVAHWQPWLDRWGYPVPEVAA